MVQSPDRDLDLQGSLWAIPVVVPLLIIFLSFFFSIWDWGLMDDHGRALYPTTFEPLDLTEFGLIRPTFSAYSAIFYRLFNDWVIGFYVFKLSFAAFTLVVWGYLSYRITGEVIGFWLVPIVTLSFHYFYDAIFYLSAHEVIGLFFLGMALHCFLSAIIGKENKSSRQVVWALELLGLFFLILAFFSKEPFVSSGIAVGIGYLYLSTGGRLGSYERKRNWNELVTAILVISFSLGYGSFLMFNIRGGYSAGYDPLNMTKMFGTLYEWTRKDFVNHMPWIVGTLWILFSCPRRYRDQSWRFRWAIVSAGFIYLGYLFLLLPWSTVGYYATPLGLFFGFFVSLVVAKRMKSLSVTSQGVAILISLMLNITVCLYGLNRELVYQYDTSNLLQWVRVAADEEKFNFSSVATNAMEPAQGIPNLLKLKWDISIPPFEFVGLPQPDRHQLFLYSPRFGSLRNCQRWSFYPTVLSRLSVSKGKAVCYRLEEYRVLMVSNNWIVFALKKDV